MTEQIPSEMDNATPEQTPQPAATPAAEMVSISASELEQIRAALKKANGEAAKYRKTAETVEAERKAKAEAEMTELQKAQARAAELEAELTKTKRASMQSEIAAKVGLPAKLASRLQGNTPEEMEADAKDILETLPKQPKPTPGIAASNPGANGQANETDAQKLARLRAGAVDPFSLDGARRFGGGVTFSQE